MLFCLIISVLSATAERPECVVLVRNVCLAARTLSPLPHVVDSNIRPAENHQTDYLVSGKKQVAADSAKIFEDRFLFEEGVCRWHMTDAERNIDRKD